jgi:diadenosine tetraphosphatase ApaH/serine/threonine PP2A family protein phosphatase
MRIALLADIHANREALDAVLFAVNARGVDRIAVLGDIVGYGPDPAYCTERVASLVSDGAIAIMGNHDAAIDGTGDEDMNRIAREAIRWTRTRLDSAHRSFLANLPMAHREDDLLLIHASANHPRQWEYVTDETTAERCIRAAVSKVTVVGHTHEPCLWRLTTRGTATGHAPTTGMEMPLARSQLWLAVMGAVGQPRDGNTAACFGTIDTAKNALTYERVDYDHYTTARKVREAGLPTALSERLLRAR